MDVDGNNSIGSGGGVGSAVGKGCGDSGRDVGGSWLCGGWCLSQVVGIFWYWCW